MIAVIFELIPKAGHKQAYLDIAASLKPTLEGMDGFLSVERFQSLANPEKILSLSFWRDEEAVRKWRNLQDHRAAQSAGRGAHFQTYRLRVADVLRDYGMTEREDAPDDSHDFHTTQSTRQN